MGSANLALVLLPLCFIHAAAYEELLLVRPTGDANRTVAWPVEHTDTDFLRVIQESLAAVMDTPKVKASLQMLEKQSPETPPVVRAGAQTNIAFKVLGKERNTGIFLSFPDGCRTKDPKTYCHVDLESQKGPGRVNIVHGVPFSSNATFALSFDVESKWIRQGSKVRCPACGQPCHGTFMGRTWTVDLPSCPIPVGTWSLRLPFLTRQEVQELELVPAFSVNTRVTVLRSDGSTAVDFEGQMEV